MDYRNIIESKYDRKSWLELLHDIFKSGVDFRSTPPKVEANDSIASSAVQLGSIKLADDNMIAVYEIRLTESVDIAVNRVGIRNLLITDWKSKGYAGAFMFCFRDNESVLRFSYVSSSFQFTDEGRLEKSETDTKRFTYLLGAGHRSRTAIKQFEDLKNSKLTLSDLTKAFSVEALSDRFFKDYKSIYEDIIEHITGKRMTKVANKWEEKVTHEPDKVIMEEFSRHDDPEKAVRDYVKKLMGRIVFLQFIQKKGWLGVPVDDDWGDGDKEFLQDLYNRTADKENFIDNVLEVLFNDINTKRTDDVAAPVLGDGIRLPYLNGGLFDYDKTDEYSLKLPKALLDKMFAFFSAYNFTIDENDPDDAEIGVDPEMLGRIFENLLEDNKDKGAFYTPKEIVQYMCRESLIAYLQTGMNDSDKEAVRAFVTTHDKGCLNDTLLADIDRKLKDVKICDPAIGSGAFPMGLLKELFACRAAIEGIDEDKATNIKRHIIQNNIYGVDIEKGAVDIARLRFWLALIVDEKTPHALPNMDFKIVQGNSLIPTFNGKYVNFNDKQRHVNSNKIRDAKKELYALQSRYYGAEGDEKKEILISIKRMILEIVRLQMDYEYRAEIERNLQTANLFNPNVKQTVIDTEKRFVCAECARLQQQLNDARKSLKERADTPVPFFDWKTIFSDIFDISNNRSGGFDLLIGNPPYIQLQANNGALGEMYQNQGFETFTKTGDIYCLFYEQGYNLLGEHGHLCYITSNKWMRAGYGEKLRDFLSTKTNPKILIDFSGVKIFDSATVDTNILLYAKEDNQNATISYKADKTSNYDIARISDYVNYHGIKTSYKTKNTWVILSDIEQSIKTKIEAVGIPLSEWDITINRGMLTGCNEAFIITSEKREEILNACVNEDERKRTDAIIRPILRGRDIKRYGCNWAGLWIINTHNGVRGRFPKIEINNYPAIKSHLDQYWNSIRNRTDKGDTPYNLRNCAYLEDFDEPKIIYPNMTKYLPFVYDNSGKYTNQKCFIVTGKHIAYLTAFFNSSLFKYCFRDAFPELLGGTREMSKIFFDKIPVLKINDKIDKEFESMVLDIQNKYTIEKAKQIDNKIFEIYNLKEEERKRIGFIDYHNTEERKTE